MSTQGEALEQFHKARSDPKFVKRFFQAKKNKRRGGDPEEEVEPTHYGGSQSMHQRAMELKKKTGELPIAAQLFLDTKSKVDCKGQRGFISARDQEIWDAYIEATSTDDHEGRDPNEVWFNIVQGYRKGAVYGTGNAHTLYWIPPNARRGHSTSTEYVPSVVVEMRSELQDERAQRTALAERVREQD